MSEEAELPVPAQSRFRFGLPQLFYVTALVASGLALSPHTIWISLVVLLVWSGVYRSTDRRQAILAILFPLLFVTPVVLLLLAGYIIRESHPGLRSLHNLRQVMLAVLNYESEHGEFPSDRIVTLADGTELRHSWRIEILPHVEERALYGQYDFNEPWSGPNNSQLQLQMPRLFSRPNVDGSASEAGHTSYKLVNGPGTAFEAGKKIGLADLTDGVSNTIGLIEDNANQVNWLEPGDFTAQDAAKAMNSIARGKSVQVHDQFFERSFFGGSYMMLDGSSYYWPPQSNRPMRPGAFLIADGDLFDTQIQGRSFREIKYHVYITLAVYILLLLLPAIYFLRPTENGSAVSGS